MSEFPRKPEQARPIVSVVIPTHARPALLQRCLSALAGQDSPAESFEIIVVEDGGPGLAKDVVERASDTFPIAMSYIAVPRGGPAAARNSGWQAARGEIIAFTDDDTIPDRRWLSEGARSIAEGADVVSGRTVVPLPPTPTDADRNTQGLERATLATCNAFCRRGLLEATGGFDHRFRRAYREDSDLEFTLRKAGARLVSNPLALVVHPPRAESRFVSLSQQQHQLYDALLYRKHPEDFRKSIRAWPPFAYYSVVLAQIVTAVGIIGRRPRLASIGLLVWAPQLLRFFQRRARGTRATFPDRFALLLTSIAIPPLAIYWRLRGALRFRVPFL
jgi:glycosyltransferase involved in cell wall biosynthesis